MAYDDDDTFEEPPHLRRLRLLVTVLTLVLIGGIVIITAVIVIRLGAAGEQAKPVAAAEIGLPAGATVITTGRGEGTVLFLLRDAAGAERLHVFDAVTGAALSVTDIAREE